MPHYTMKVVGIAQPLCYAAQSRAQARYRAWKQARDAGWRVTLPVFASEWAEWVRISTPTAPSTEQEGR